MILNEDKLVNKVLLMVLGRDAHTGGAIECASPLLQEAIEGLTYGLSRADNDLIEGSLKSLQFAIFNSIECNRDDCMEPRDINSNPEEE